MYIIKEDLIKELEEIKEAGLYKEERIILTPQRACIGVKDKEVINFCANNYLGLADNKEIIEAAKKSLDRSWIWHVISKIYLWYSGYT